LLTESFIQKWDKNEQDISSQPLAITPLFESSSNQSSANIQIVSPAEMVATMQGTYYDIPASTPLIRKYGSNSSKRYVELDTNKQKSSKVKDLIETVKNQNPKYTNEDLIALFSDAVEYFSPKKKLKRNIVIESRDIQQQVNDLNLPPIEKKLRKTWKLSQKQYVIDRMELVSVNIDIKIKQAILDSLGGIFQGLQWSQVKRWITNNEEENMKPGPKVNEEFESAIWSRLLITIKKQVFDVDKNEMTNQVKVLQNITYSYEIIKGVVL
jgi:hypothetical protein